MSAAASAGVGRRRATIRAVVGALLVAGACTGDGEEAARSTTTAMPTTVASPTTTVAITTTVARPVATWTGKGFAGLEWGADRRRTMTALRAILGAPDVERPNQCGQYAQWEVPRVTVSFNEDGRFGTLVFDLDDFPHASGATVGDPLGDLQSAEPGGTWKIFGTDGRSGSTGQQEWLLQQGDSTTFGLASGPAPGGRLEDYIVQYSATFQAPPCGD